MKTAVIGGTGLVGSQVVRILNASGYETLPFSPSSGVDLLSGAGLPEALQGTDTVVILTKVRISCGWDEPRCRRSQLSLG